MPVNSVAASSRHVRGFTLIELVIGIVVFAIVLTLVTSLIVPQAGRSVDPIMQVRATALAKAVLNEIAAKAYDEAATNPDVARCNDDLNGDGDYIDDVGEAPCTAAVNLGTDSAPAEFRNGAVSNFDDVDDFNGLRQGLGETDSVIRNSLGETLLVNGTNLYNGFNLQVDVSYVDATQNQKLVTVTVTTSGGQALVFSTIKSNF